MRILVILYIIMSTGNLGCGKEEEEVIEEPTPVTSLTINNQNDIISIREVSLVGYEFEDIKIDFGQARTFTLDNGINGGLTGVNINVRFYCGARNWSGSVSKDFTEGQNTTVTVVDCFPNGQGGCSEVCYQ